MVILFLVGMMVCLSRNNGVYIVIPSMVCLTLYVQKERSRYVILLICLMVCYQGLEGYVAPQLGVEKGSVKEVLSIPFQHILAEIVFLQIRSPFRTADQQTTSLTAITGQCLSHNLNGECLPGGWVNHYTGFNRDGGFRANKFRSCW